MAGVKKTLQGLGAAAALGGVLAVKAPLVRWYLRRRERKQQVLRSNRLQFAKLSRAQQRSVLYYRRAQLRDLETIYRQGYAPRGGLARRRRRLF